MSVGIAVHYAEYAPITTCACRSCQAKNRASENLVIHESWAAMCGARDDCGWTVAPIDTRGEARAIAATHTHEEALR